MQPEQGLLLELARGGASASMLGAEGFAPPEVAAARSAIAHEAVALMVETGLNRSIGRAAGGQTSKPPATPYRGAMRTAGVRPSRLRNDRSGGEPEPGTAAAPEAAGTRHRHTGIRCKPG